MPPKKGKKMNLNEFLGDSSLGSWADEMDALPTAPAMRSEDDMGRDRFSRPPRDDFSSSRPDRPMPSQREDLPLPTSPPFTAFIGNLSFTATELEMERHFGSAKIKSIKIIRGPDDRPKGFGYIEFTDLEGLKQGIALTGTELAGRVIRVSVADPPKERPSGGFEDSTKFDSPWRREGPLPPLPGRDPPRRRNDSNASDRPPSVSETNSDWRASARARPPPPPPESDTSVRRKDVGFGGMGSGAADRDDVWARGSNFKPSDEPPTSRFGGSGGFRGKEPSKDAADEDSDWRGARNRSSTSPTSSNPPTPQMGRRKLDLLPRSSPTSTTSSPLSSPKLAPTQAVSRPSPFGAARPVDVSSREKEVAERLEKDREAIKERVTHHPMSRSGSRQGSERSPLARAPSSAGSERPVAPATASTAERVERPKVSTAPNVSPGISFANMAARKDAAAKEE